MQLNRRDFLFTSAVATVGATLAPVRASAAEKPVANAKVGEPVLWNPAPTTLSVGWGVPQLSYGAVEVSDDASFTHSRRFICSKGFGQPIADDVALTVTLTGLKPNTVYHYRTVTTPILSYPNAYKIKVGKPIIGAVHSFRTVGAAGVSRIAVINDTHMRTQPFVSVTERVKAIKPAFCVWNGDATTSSEKKSEAAGAFYDSSLRDYATEIPYAFVYGNHDFRGRFAPWMAELIPNRETAEREACDAALGHCFALRQGDLAVIGLDTGEDKTDDHPQMYGHATYDAYRLAQAEWLKRALNRPDIASAPFVIACCHIPLFDPHPNACKGTPQDFRPSDKHYFGAHWAPYCAKVWGPILTQHGVQLVVAAHMHRYRYDKPTSARPWGQIVGGGPYVEEGDIPTVVECAVEKGRLVARVHDVKNDRILNTLSYAPRRVPSSGAAV